MRKFLLQIAFVVVFFELFFISSCSAQMRKESITIINQNGEEKIVEAEIAITVEEHQNGFMERKKIPEGTGMLFVFDRDQQLSFWMKNTPTALSIAYIDSKGVIRDIFDMEPFSLEAILSTRSVRYALEVPQGWFEKNNIKVGNKVIIPELNQ